MWWDYIGMVVGLLGLIVSVVAVWLTALYGEQSCRLLRDICRGLKL